MKNLLFILITTVFFTSCKFGTSYGNLSGTSPLYEMKVQAKNGDDSKVDVTFTISSDIVDSLKISEDTIKIMCERACLYSDFTCKYPMTYKFSNDTRPMLMFNDNEMSVLMHGSAQNAFGVSDKIITLIKFDNNYEVVVDEILSF